MYQMSSVDLYFMCKELQFLSGAKISKIYGSEGRKDIIIQFHKPGEGKKLLRVKAPNCLYLIEEKEAMPELSDFVTVIRKKLSGLRVDAIEQRGFERVFAIKAKYYVLYVELFSRGNIILTEDNKILIASEYKKWSDRTIRPKAEYIFPVKERYITELSESEFVDIARKQDKEVVKFLAADIGLGGMYAEELCLRAKVDKKSKELSRQEAAKIYNEFFKMLKSKMQPRVYDNIPVPITMKKCKGGKEFKTFSQAIASVDVKAEKIDPEILRQEKIIEQQELSIKELEKKAQEEQLRGEYLYEHYQKISKILEDLQELRKGKAWKEAKKHDYILEVNEKEKSVVVDL